MEIVFDACYHARLGPHDDSEGVEVLRYTVDPPAPGGGDYLDWLARRWREVGICPRSGFWVAKRSAWMDVLPDFFRRDFRHFIVDGRDGYVELIARRFAWRARAAAEVEHESDPTRWPVVDQGEGAA
ncbi:MAG TPA: hypothetical protein VGR35_22265 [Tepidisphaeraceae bacterium]|nr:hypothetical protein [Tepidisphaeraceae bacterium]